MKIVPIVADLHAGVLISRSCAVRARCLHGAPQCRRRAIARSARQATFGRARTDIGAARECEQRAGAGAAAEVLRAAQAPARAAEAASANARRKRSHGIRDGRGVAVLQRDWVGGGRRAAPRGSQLALASFSRLCWPLSAFVCFCWFFAGPSRPAGRSARRASSSARYRCSPTSGIPPGCCWRLQIPVGRDWP